MVLADVNIWMNAFRPDCPEHQRCRGWLEAIVAGEARFGVSPQVLSSVVRILTNPKAFLIPDPIDEALGFCQAILDQPNCVQVRPGERHWQIFTRLCLKSGAKGNLVPDAWFAALAIEHGCTWLTLDRDFARFSGLNWTAP
ncbi:MAG: type II toxin-antitoxin system VapC family toxin [Acidobacteriota bacterium]